MLCGETRYGISVCETRLKRVLLRKFFSQGCEKSRENIGFESEPRFPQVLDK
jgi:hypothetical protein